MALTLELATKQSLTLSPLMLQRLELMALPLQDLQAKIQEAVESNPALEIPANFEKSLDRITDTLPAKVQGDDYSDSSAYGSDLATSATYDREASDRKQSFMENALASGETLMEHLLEQLHTDHLTEEENHVGELIISNLDGHGFNRTDPYSLLSPVSVTKSEEPTEQQRQTIERILKKVQRYEPIGCATSDWRQSVVIQAEEKGLQGSQLETFDMLVHFFLEKIREGKRVQVCKKLDITETQLDDYLELLKSLTPYPGNAYDSAPDSFIIPDISIHAKDGKLEMTTSAANLPDLEISRDFIELGRDITDKETKKYIKDQLAAAKELITQIKMRNGNIYKLGLILLERQSEYFLKGPLYLKPLTQKEVAQQMDVHETTVSRLANSKWIDCDWGIVPVKSLFSVAVATGDTPGSNEMSKTAIKEVIKQILEANEGKKALSDQKIANKLEEQGIKIARRTVAKYRKELNIDTAYIRNANL